MQNSAPGKNHALERVSNTQFLLSGTSLPGLSISKFRPLAVAVVAALSFHGWGHPLMADTHPAAIDSQTFTDSSPTHLLLAQTDKPDSNEDIDESLFLVTSAADHGKGSLRWALNNALDYPGSHTIRIDAEVDEFIEPRVIHLDSPLPDIHKVVEIDGYLEGRLWRASGVTISGQQQLPLFRVTESGDLELRNLTLRDGKSRRGGAIRNKGRLLISGVTFINNQAGRGGAIYHQRGRLDVFNSTFSGNSAKTGGAIVTRADARIINTTFTDNSARKGGAIWNRASLHIANNILANSSNSDCYSSRAITATSTHNLIENNDGCGTPLISDDPRLDPLGYYNGPTQTFPLGGGSPAINLGNNAAAINEQGDRFIWDQRGNGDPRFVAGYTDLGAFEHQAFPKLVVDIDRDNGLRGCTPAGPEDCPLRAAIELANESDDLNTITFDPRYFTDIQEIIVSGPLPLATKDLTIDASNLDEISLKLPSAASEIAADAGITVTLVNIKLN